MNYIKKEIVGCSVPDAPKKLHLKKMLSFLLAIAMLFSITAGIDLSANAATNHTQQEAVNWINSQVGKSLDYDGAYGAQCVDLIYYYYQYLGVAVQGGNGSDYAWNTLPSGWKRINYSNGFTPQGGDIGVWSGVNHVGIWASSSVFVDQNSNGRSYVASNSNLASIGLSLSSMACVIRPDFKTQTTLSAPSNVKYKCYENKAKITWNSVSGANCYDVIVTDPSGTTNWYHTDGTEKEITITKKGRYKFNVQSLYRQNGNTVGQIVGAHSSECYFEVNIFGPTNVNVNCISNKLKVTWDAADGADCYDVIVTDPSGITNWYHTTGTDKEITVSKTGQYNIDVQSLYRPNGNTTGQVVGEHSRVVAYYLNSIETTLEAPVVKATVNTNGSFTISWNKVANADKYEVYCYDNNYGNYKLYKTTTETSVTTDIGIPGVTYYYKVKAIDSKNYYESSVFSESIHALNEEHIHTWNNGNVTKKATCIANGVTTYTCTVCKATKTETIKATGHKSVTDKAVAATCTTAGKTAGSHCSVCNAVITAQKTVPATGHSYDSGKVTKAASCTANGTKTYTCTKCKAIKTETIKATGHKAVTDKAVAATCTKAGKTAGSHCSVCNVVITAQKTIPATGHSYDDGKVTEIATCKATGTKTYTCSKCGVTKTETIAKTEHTYETTIIYIATTKTNGSITKKCSVCGATTKTTIYYPKTITLSKTSYVYNGKAQKPTVTVKDSKGKKISASNYTVTYASGRKNVGIYKVTIKFKGNYSGTVTKTFTINPKSTTLSSVTAKSKGFTAKWKKLTTQTTGYQIQYSTSSKFSSAKTVTVSKNSTTSKSVSKLKAKKKYYVRIRTYKTVKVNGKSTKIYSSWSKSKAVTTKK